MIWLAVDENEEEYVYKKKPSRRNNGKWAAKNHWRGSLAKGMIKMMIGRKLTWNDEPVGYDKNK